MGVVYAARDEKLERARRPQDHVVPRARRHRAQAVLARGPRRGQREPSERLPALRDRRGPRRAVHRHGAARGRVAGGAAAGGADERGRDAAHRASGCWPRSRRCTRAGSSTATSSRRTSSSRRTASSSWTSAWPARASPPLARPPPGDATLTGTGIMVGTPRYMAPEQVTGEALDARSDLFAAGAILFEMLAGRPAFAGRNAVEILHATLHEQPPALTGSPAVAAVDRVIRRALAKRPAERPASADAMADELRAVRGVWATTRRRWPARSRASWSCPSACCGRIPRRTSWPSACPTRSPPRCPASARSSCARARPRRASRARRRTSRRWPPRRTSTASSWAPCSAPATSSGPPRSSWRRRAGTLLSSHTVQSSLGDLFHLQDDMARRVVEALALPLGGETPPPTPDEPRDARAYELFLRANELARGYDQLPEARDLYQRCLELDPKFAPAWARLGRCHWVIGKYIHDPADSAARAEEAFRRALDLNPRLAVAHRLYASFEGDTGHSLDALVRLLGEGRRARQRRRAVRGPRPRRPVLRALRAVHGRARGSAAARPERRHHLRADDADDGGPRPPAARPPGPPLAAEATTDPGHGLGLAGRRDEARQILDELARARIPALAPGCRRSRPGSTAGPKTSSPACASLGGLTITDDPEGLFQDGLDALRPGRARAGPRRLPPRGRQGFYAAPTLAASPAFDALRDDPASRRCWPTPRPARGGAGRVPRGRRRGAARASPTGSEDPGPPERQGGDPPPAPHRAPGQRPPLRTMSAHQMVCHLSDSFRAVMGAQAGEPRRAVLSKTS